MQTGAAYAEQAASIERQLPEIDRILGGLASGELSLGDVVARLQRFDKDAVGTYRMRQAARAQLAVDAYNARYGHPGYSSISDTSEARFDRGEYGPRAPRTTPEEERWYQARMRRSSGARRTVNGKYLAEIRAFGSDRLHKRELDLFPNGNAREVKAYLQGLDRRFGQVRVRVEQGRTRGTSWKLGAGWARWAPCMKLPRWALNQPYILHEAAHLCAPMYSGHGVEWEEAYVTLVRHFLSPDDADALEAEFKRIHEEVGA